MSKENYKKKARAFDILSKAVIQRCKEDCCAGDLSSWKNCSSELCPLREFRLGGIDLPVYQKSSKKDQNNEEKSDNLEKEAQQKLEEVKK